MPNISWLSGKCLDLWLEGFDSKSSRPIYWTRERSTPWWKPRPKWVFLKNLGDDDIQLFRVAHLSPFYLREHSKRILRGALYNDSKFLADINVMDYSLVVGVDSQKNELVVGIVGKFFLQSSCMRSHCLERLRTNIYMGQEARKLGQRVNISWWRRERWTDDRHT